MNTLEYAYTYHDAGLSIIPVKCDGSKAPGVPEWTSYQSTRPKRADIMRWFKTANQGIAIIGGAVSGNLDRIDFDIDGLYADWESAIEQAYPDLIVLITSMPLVQTPRPGHHLYFRVNGDVTGNQPLARCQSGIDESEKPIIKTLIETRGTGGYTVAPGSPLSVHETGRPYQLLRGDFAHIPIISEIDRDRLYEVARMLNEYCPEQQTYTPKSVQETNEDAPGTEYNRRADWRQLMIKEGWSYVFSRGETEYWRRPGKLHGISASFNNGGHNTFYVFTSNAYPFEQNTSYSPFGLYATIQCNGDFSAAATRLQIEGYGEQSATANVFSGSANSVGIPIHIADSELPERIYQAPAIPFDNLIPKTGYLSEYCKYANGLTDAPKEFHLAAALSIVGAALGNNVAVHVWGQSVFPNLWNILLAPSGFYRKSTAITIAMRTIKGRMPNLALPNDYSREKLVDNLKAEPEGVGILPVYEFGEMLAKMGRDYMAGTKEMFTEIYDGNEYTRSTKGGTVTIAKPALSILAASTIDWIHDRIGSGDVRGGFLARFCYWPAREKNGWMGLSDSPDFKTTQYLQAELELLHSISGIVQITPEIKKRFDAWVHVHEDEVNNRQLPEEVQGFYTRLATYALKFAIVYEAATNRQADISPESLDYGIRLVEYLKSHLVQLISEELLTTKDAKDLKMVFDLIKRSPGISRERLLKNSHMMAKRLNDILLTLLEAEQVIATKIETKTRTGMIYFPAEK